MALPSSRSGFFLRAGTTTPLACFLCGLLCILLGYVIGSFQNDPSAVESVLTAVGSTAPSWSGRLLSEKGLAEEEEEGSGDFKGEDEEDDDPQHLSIRDLRIVMAIVVMLILLTIAFEMFKEHVEHAVPDDMEIIFEKLFGELTVLGFLSIVTFVISQTGLFDKLSERVYGGHDGEEELLEVFEYVHFTIFFIMIFFVAQVLILAKLAGENEEYWETVEKACRDPAIATSEQGGGERPNWFRRLCDQALSPQQDKGIYRGLRREFLLERSLVPPFHPVPEQHRVHEDGFDFARYLALAQAHTLTHVVEVKIGTWFFFVVGTIVFYGLAVAVHESILLLGIIWVGIGWAVYLYNIAFARHLILLREKFVPKSVLEESSTAVSLLRQSSSRDGDTAYADAVEDETENSALLTNHHGGGVNSANVSTTTSSLLLPAWCDLDLDHYLQHQRPWMAKMLVGGSPNRHQAFFWMNQRGPDCYLSILQVNLIFTGIYAGLLILLFFPPLYHLLNGGESYYFWLYVVMATLPILGITYNKKQVVAALAVVSSIGSYRKAQIVSDVMREVKTRRVVRTFVVVTQMRHTARAAAAAAAAAAQKQPPRRRPGRSMAERASSFSHLEQMEVGHVFDAFDVDGSSSITKDEFQSVLARLGAELASDELDSLFQVLDPDGSGRVSKEEFLYWYEGQAAVDNRTSLHERARDLFHMFDSNDSGEITIGEFKSKIDALEMDFSVDDVGCLLRELDRDRRGSVSHHEFEHLLEKYYPKELRNEENE